VGKEVVLQFLGEKTKIPMGAVVGSERESLLGLEDKLKGQVVGQPAALTAISQALRRGRAGLSSKLRPIGTFLFLGPTGVGKTETAKALARTMFGKEEALLRLDMSEYQSSDALNRLIGSFADNKPGILATLIRENPYGVLLLDEFEKTEKGVLNLFLQILDEGFFSDAFGRRVNARNLVFIATSNAAAELIWHLVESGRDPAGARTEIVGTLIEKGIFRPELLNRFDEIIFFHPLQIAELRQVARLMLVKTVSNLRGQGIDLRLTDELVNQVAQAGTDRVFGARPLRRYIQDKVEQQVADAIIRGDLRAGNSVEFRDGKLSKIA
jgi:ATP-dependent Clp protease ATP-binding subunit ClpA